jgi:hypothetical protein
MKSRDLRSMRNSEGKGLLGCVIFIVLFGAAVYLGITLGPIYYANFNFESGLKTEASRAGAHFLDDEAVTKDILELARRNEIKLTREGISIQRFAGQIHIEVLYSVPVDFIIMRRNLNFDINASSFIGTL